MTSLVRTSIEATRSVALSPLNVRQDSYNPWALARVQLARKQPSLADVIDIFDIILITMNICVLNFYALRLRWLLVLRF